MYEESNAEVENFEDFQDYIFSILTVYTETKLTQISEFLTNTLRKNIDYELDSLKKELDLISTERPLGELSQNIIDAKVDLQNELYGISDWFVISDSAIDKHMDVRTLIECSFESSNIQHPNTPIHPEIITSDKFIFYNYKHFVFIFINLIDNIRIHSKLQSEELNVTVSVDKVDNKFNIKVRNNLNKSLVNKELLNSKLNTIKENWNEEIDYNRVNKEGGTGFEKIKKILAYDIKLKDHEFDYILDKDYLEIIFRINSNPT